MFRCFTKVFLAFLLVIVFTIPSPLAYAQSDQVSPYQEDSSDNNEEFLVSHDGDTEDFDDADNAVNRDTGSEDDDLDGLTADGLDANLSEISGIEGDSNHLDNPGAESSSDEDILLEFSEESEELTTTLALFTAATAQLNMPISEGRYLINPQCTETRVIDISAGSKSSGANVQLYSSNMTPAQFFDVSFDAVTGLYTIKNAGSGLALDVQAANATSGANVWQYALNGTAAQKWYITEDPKRPGTFKIISALSTVDIPATATSIPTFRKELVLDIYGAGNYDGANVQIFTANGTAAQSFRFVPMNPAVSPGNANVPDGDYVIYSKVSNNRVLDIQWASESNGAPLQTYSENGTFAQYFRLKKESDGFYSIRAMHSGFALDVPAANLMPGTIIQQYSNNNTTAQRWAIYENGDGTYTIISKASGLALDVISGSTGIGALLWQWTPNGTNAQKFTFKALPTVPFIEGYVGIVPKSQPSKSVDIAGASQEDGANAQIYKSNDTFAQMFEVKQVSAGTYAFQAIHSGQYLTAAGSNVFQSKGDNGEPKDSQKWVLERVFGGYTIKNVLTGEAMAVTAGGMDGHDLRLAAPTGATSQIMKIVPVQLKLAKGVYHINNFFDLHIDSVNAGTANNTNIQVFTKNYTVAQQWMLEWVNDEYFVIKCPRSGRVLNIRNGSTADNTQVQLYDYSGNSAQLWRLVPSGDGWFRIQSASGLYLTANPGNKSGTSVTVSSKNLGDAQKFRFTPSTYSGYSGTYIDVNLTTQRLLFINDGQIMLACDVVTGAPGMQTPTGTFSILNKQSPAVLAGPGWWAPVDFWMPFTVNGHGFHDANWQPWFGGDRWTYAGSHGCVNMPFWAARDLYNLISIGTTVYIHW